MVDPSQIRPKSNLEGFVQRHQSIAGLIYLRDNWPRNANFWQVGLLDVVLSALC